jgi:hypothetical protein
MKIENKIKMKNPTNHPSKSPQMKSILSVCVAFTKKMNRISISCQTPANLRRGFSHLVTLPIDHSNKTNNR